MKRAKKGFTLVEVIIVLVIIAIVAAIAVPNISGYIKRSKANNCQHTMNDFVNDLEYKIVSKRYYDVSELNDELIKLVDSYADSYEPPAPDTPNGKFTSLTTELKKVTGICPNGGQYTVGWLITPGDVENPNTAKVMIQTCECNCMDQNEHVKLSNSYELTAALIDTSEYLKSNRSAVNIYEADIQKIIRYIDGKLENGNPSNIAEVVKNYKTENPESKYSIIGVTVKEQRDGNPDKSKWVEWICVDLNKNNDPDFNPDDKSAHDFIVYYPDEKNEETVSEAAEEAAGVPSDKKLVVMPFSENMASHNAYWPPAEGNSGSYIYSEKLSYTNGQTYQVAGVDHPELISWIQRDGNWYVEKTDYSKGIDDLENSRPENPEEHVLISRKVPDSISVGTILESEALPPDSRNVILIDVSYKNGKDMTKFSHMKVSEDGSTIKNGYVIVSSEEEYRDKKWAGVYADSTSPDAVAELNTRKEILDKEETLVRDFFSGKINKLVVAYQEYTKVYNETKNSYEVKPVTCFGEVTMSTREDGVKEIKIGNDVVATVEAAPGKTSDYDVYFDQAVVSGDTFRVEDLSIKKSAEYLIKNISGDVVGRAVVSENIPHASKVADGEVGFFVSEKWTGQGYIPDDEDDSVLHINRGMGQGFIFVTDDSMAYETIGHIHTYENGGYLNWSYDKGENDTEFDINKLKATVSYKVNVENKSGSSVGEGIISYNYNHKTDNDSYGFYLVDKNTYEQGTSLWNQATDSKLCSELNGRYSAARVMIDYYKYDGNNQRNVTSHLCDIANYFDSVTANYKNDGKGFSFNNITAEANYRIELFNYFGQSPVYTINHQKILDHESDSDYCYYITMQQYYDPSLWDLKNEELAFIGVLYGGYSDDKYVAVAYNDGNLWGNSVTKRAPIYINCTDINPPEIVYIPFSGTQDAYAIAYIGSGKDITVNSSYEGYWSETSPDSSVSDTVVKISAGNKDYYYIDDQKTYNITRIGNAPSGNDERQFAIPNTSGITRMEIKNGIEEIGPGAFKKENSDYFKKDEAVIILSDSVNAIGKNAFSGLNIGNIVLGNITKNITDGTVTSASSDNSRILSIGSGAFSETTLSVCDAFVVPKTVASIGEGAFSNFNIGNGGLFIDGVSNASDNSISDDIFNGTIFGRLKFGTRVEKIEPEAFKDNTSSAALDLGNVKVIGGNAFSGWEKAYADLIIPDSVQDIGLYAFDSYASAQDNHLKYPSLTVNGGSFTADNTTKLGSFIFTNSHFRNVSIGGNVDEIDNKAFDNAPLKGKNPYNEFRGNLKISGEVSKIGKNAFKDCSGFDGELTLPDSGSLRTIDNSAFSGCFRFTGGLTIPDGAETIGSEAFANCLGFNGNLALPNALSGRMGLLEIGDEAFVNCQGINGNLTIPDTVQRIGISTFEGCTGFNGSIKLSSTLKKIGAEAFKNCTNIKGGLIIPETVTEAIGSYAFENFASEVSDSEAGKLVIGSGSYEGKTLGAYIFDGSKFNDIYIGGIVENIGKSAFQHGADPSLDAGENEQGRVADYSKIKGKLTIGESVKVVDNLAFKGMGVNALEGMSNVQRIGRYAFWKCDKIASDVTFEGNTSLERIEREAFYGTTSLGSLTIPPTVTFMGPYAFDNSGSGNGRLVIFGASRIEDGKKYLGDNKYSGQPDTGGTLFNHARYRDVVIGGNVDVIGQYFMKSDFIRTDGSYDTNFDHHGITGSLTITGHVSEIEGEAFNDAGFDGTLTLSSSKLETIGYSAFENLPNMYGDLVIPQTVHNIDRRAFKKFAMNAPDSKLGTLSIKGYSETNGNQHIIGYRLFSFARFKSVEIGGENSSVNTIGNFAFYNSSLETNSTMEDNQTVYEVFNSGSGYTDEDIKVYRNLKYDERNEGVKVNNDNSNYSRFTPELKILDGIETIGTRAFGDNHSILKVNLESSTLKTIGKDAFNRCTNAGGGLTIPKTVTSIGRCAFKQYGENTDNPGTLKILGYSDNVGGIKYIGIPLNNINDDPKPIFPSAKFNNVVIGGNDDEATVNAIGDKFMNNVDPSNNTYNYSGMTGSLTIGKSIKSVGREAFVLCTGFNGALTLNENLVTIGHDAFNACNNFHGDLTIPSTVTSIGSYAFKHFGQGMITSGDNTGSLTILGYSSVKNGLNTIDKDIFNHGHFTNVTIGGNVQSIADDFMNNQYTDNFGYGDVHRFEYVKGKLTIGNSVQKIGKTSFLLCEGFDGPLTLNENLVSIGESAFNACISFHGDLLIPSTVSSIGKDAFKHFGQGGEYGSNDNKGSLTVLGYSSTKDGLRTIDKDIFNHAHFTNVTVGGELNGHKATVQCIADDFMENNSLETFNGVNVHKYSNVRGDLTIGAGVEKIGSQAFWNCNGFTGKLEIAETVEYIGQSAFSGLYELYTNVSDKNERILKIPSSVEYMGPYAFKALSAAMDQNTKGQEINNYPAVVVHGSSGTNGVLGDNKAIFSMARINGLTIGGSVVTIADDFMNNERHSTEATRYEDGNKEKDESNDHLYSYVYGDITIGDEVKSIGNRAFKYVQYFDKDSVRGNLTLGNKVETIGEEAFANVRAYAALPADQRNLTIPGSVKKIGQKAFDGFCSAYQNPPSLTIEGYSENDSNHTLGTNIFTGASFKNVTIGGSAKTIADNFMDNSNYQYDGIIGNLDIKDGAVSSIGSSAFKAMKFDTVKIGKGITKIKNSAFTSAGTGNGALEIYSGTDSSNSNMIGKNDVFKNAKFNGVTIGGDVRYIDGTAFMNSADFSGLKGTLTLLPKSVGYIDGSYQLVQSKSNGVYVGGGMQFSAPSLLSQFFRGTSKYGPFWGCDFNKAVFPEDLFESFNNNIYYSVWGYSIDSHSKYYEGLFDKQITFQKY